LKLLPLLPLLPMLKLLPLLPLLKLLPHQLRFDAKRRLKLLKMQPDAHEIKLKI
jgi:hypothetical protein